MFNKYVGDDFIKEYKPQFLKNVPIFGKKTKKLKEFNTDIVKFDKLKDLMLSVIAENEEQHDFISGGVVEFLFGDYFVIKVVEDKFKIVGFDTLYNCLNQISEYMLERLGLEDSYPINIDNFDEEFQNFTKVLESKIQLDTDMVYSKASDRYPFDFLITKKNTKIYKLIKEYVIDNEVLKPNENGFIYECGYKNFKNFVQYNLVSGRPISLILRSKIKNQKMHKIYGFILLTTDKGIKYVQLDSEELVESYVMKDKDDNILGLQRDEIYCGKTDDDIICGFDRI